MNKYGHTVCPDCTAWNSLYRPLKVIRASQSGAFNDVKCWNCGKEYKHLDQMPKTEADNVWREGRD